MRKKRLENSFDPHAKFGLHPWPNHSKNPSPKEIFGFESLSVPDFDKLIKRKYVTYVKIYHPDVSSKYDIYDGEVMLTPELKRQRYDQISNAYNILKDPRRRHAYWRYENSRSNYAHDPKSSARRRPSSSFKSQSESSFQRFRDATAHSNAHAYQNDEAFWQAATWEDYYKMKYKKPPPTAEEIERNKYRILAGVLVVGFMSAVLQYLYAVKRTEDFHAEQALMNLRSGTDEELSKRNYNYGMNQNDRLKRFMLSRRFNYMDRGDVETSSRMKEEQERLLPEYGAQDSIH